jgi:DNA-binding FadR family transcriptional regulator
MYIATMGRKAAEARTRPREETREPARARHAADAVFDPLAVAIIEGSLAPGSSLPPERELSERFGVSRLIVRQAVHRLAEIGLVRVRQGGPTQVVHPNDARDIRVVELIYRLGRGSPRDVRELLERQFLHGYSLLFLAARRASKERLQAIANMAIDYADRGSPLEEMTAFERRFFGALAEATDNRFYVLETSWWFKLTEDRPARPPALSDEQRSEFYRELAHRLASGRDAARFYMETVGPVLDMLGSLALLARPEK